MPRISADLNTWNYCNVGMNAWNYGRLECLELVEAKYRSQKLQKELYCLPAEPIVGRPCDCFVFIYLLNIIYTFMVLLIALFYHRYLCFRKQEGNSLLDFKFKFCKVCCFSYC